MKILALVLFVVMVILQVLFNNKIERTFKAQEKFNEAVNSTLEAQARFDVAIMEKR